MAVLKSFELKGNKLSFANWISNLSPTTTPFTSMIGKEQIDETQYSWQTDGLARASNEAFLEGSQAESQARAATKVITNFTSNFRKAVNVSDTANAITSYGRTSELAYQMSKAGKEMLRDVEAANLSKKIGHIGSDADASVFTGFNFLCGPMYAIDPDTQAITHQGVSVTDITKPWFAISDIFEITTNLYLSGSTADKIMFHPRHIGIFSDLLGFNEEAPNVHRLFEGLDGKFNMNVSMIKDPLGRLYQLIPNRNMPETAVYFFNEKDWTQMVLREPKRIELAKKGSYTSSMIETEVGLRHKHPHASGVLELKAVDFDAHLSVDEERISILPGEQAGFLIHLLHKDGSPVVGMDFNIMLSDESIATLSSKAGQTGAQGSATFELVGKKPGKVTVYVYGYNTNQEFISNAITIEFISPELRIGVDDHTMALGERISAQTRVLDPVNGFLAPDGTEVTWHTDSDQIVFVDNTTGDFIGQNPTIACKNGISYVKIAAKKAGEYTIWSSCDGLVSTKVGIVVVTAGLQFLWNTPEMVYTVGVSKNEPMSVTVMDRHGVALADGTRVEWRVENGSRGTLSAQATTTTTGVTVNNFTAESAGDTYIILSVHGDEFKHKITCANLNVQTILQQSNTIGLKKTATLQSFVTDAAGNPVPNVTVHWVAAPTSFGEFGSTQIDTDAAGKAETTFKGLIRGDGEIATMINGIVLSNIEFYVGTGAEVNFRIIPNPAKVNVECEFSVFVSGKDGSFLAGVPVTFTSDPVIGDLSGLAGVTGPDGNYTAKYTPTSDLDSRITASAGDFDDIDTESLSFADRTLDYALIDADKKLTIGVGIRGEITYTVTENGVPVVGEKMVFVADNSKVELSTAGSGITNGSGQAFLYLEPKALGNSTITAKIEGKTNSVQTTVEIANPTINFNLTPGEITFGQPVTLSGSVLDANGDGVQGVEVDFATVPSAGVAIPTTTTVASGAYTDDWIPASNSDFEINSYIKGHPAISSRVLKLTVN